LDGTIDHRYCGVIVVAAGERLAVVVGLASEA